LRADAATLERSSPFRQYQDAAIDVVVLSRADLISLILLGCSTELRGPENSTEHFLPSMESLQIGIQAFAKYGIGF
jgi:hypothetical protein